MMAWYYLKAKRVCMRLNVSWVPSIIEWMIQWATVTSSSPRKSGQPHPPPAEEKYKV